MGFAAKALKFILTPAEAIIGGKVGKLITAAALVVAGAMSGNISLVMAGISYGASALQKKPKVSPATLDRLNANIDPAAPRKIVLGRTAMGTDVRYHAYTGTNQEYYEQILCVASHKVEAVEEIWFDTELAWTAAGGAQGRFAGYLTVAVKLEGTSGNTVAIDANWGAAQRLTGCAYLHLKFKLTGNDKKAESPFSQTIPTRVTVRGKGGFVPDPRLSTGAGGSGSQNMADQSTWAYTTAADSGRNLACQTLFYLLGWKINGKLAVGLGAPPARIDFASFINGANICDESVAKAGGGTEPRYRGDGIFSEDDDPETVLTSLLQAMNAELTDESGKIALRIDYNDLASPVVALDTSDIIDGDDWKPSAAEQDDNVVRGRYTDPSDGALYQLVDYPQVTLAGADYGSADGIQRIDSFDLPMVQSPSQAQRLAKLRLQRKQYPGVFMARLKMRGWAASYGRAVTLTYAPAGFGAKAFRVLRQTLRVDGSVDLILREVSTAQYSWSAEEAATVTPAPPTAYDPLNDPIVSGIEDAGTTAEWPNIEDVPTELTDGRIPAGLDEDGFLQTGIDGGGVAPLTVADLINTTAGTQLSANPEFQGGASTGYVVYNNAGGSKLTIAIVADVAAPNASGSILRVSYDGTGTPNTNPNPEFGGVFQELNVSATGVSTPGHYAKGTQVLLRIWAKIPVGRTLNATSNAIGTGGTIQGLTPMAGTGAWALYVFLVTLGTAGSFSSMGHLYVQDGANSAFTWDIAKYDQIDITSAPRIFGGTGGEVHSPTTGLPVPTSNLFNEQITISAGGLLLNSGSVSRVIANDQVSISGVTLIGIGSGSGASVVNSGITLGADGTIAGAGGGQITVAGMEGASGQVLRNSQISVVSGAIGGIGSGSGTVVGNSLVAIDVDGRLYNGVATSTNILENTRVTISGTTLIGIGAGSGTAVANSGVTMGADGALAGAGGGQVTVAGMESASGQVLRNSQISVASGQLTGIGTGNNTEVSNAYLDLSSDTSGSGGRARVILRRNLGGTVLTTLQLPSVAQNLDITISSNQLSGIGTGNNTVVANSAVGMDGNGKLYNGVATSTNVLENPRISISAGGVLSGAGGGQVTPAGMGYSGALADLDSTSNLRLLSAPAGDLMFDAFTYANQTAFDRAWLEVYQGLTISFGNTDIAVPGGKYIRIGDNSGDDTRWLNWKGEPTPYDPNALYELMAIARQSAGSVGQCFFGVNGYAADKTTLVNSTGANSNGNQHYIAVSSTVLPTTWTIYRGYIRGRAATGSTSACPNPASPGVVHTNVAYISPMMLVNLGTAGITDIAFIRLRKVEVASINPATGVGLNSNLMPANVLYGLIPSLKDTVTISDTDNSGTVTINIGAAVYYPDAGGTVTFPSGSSAGKAYGTKYYIKRTGVDPVSAPTGTAWNVATTLSIGVGEVYVNFYITRATGGSPSPPPPPPPGGGGDCVATDAWIETRNRGDVLASEIAADDILCVLNDDKDGTAWEPCTGNSFAWEEGLLITSESGVTVRISVSTPITLRDGSTIRASEIDGHELPVRVRGRPLVWEPCRAKPIGPIQVAHILCGQRTYAAGDVAGRSILTHNPKP